jgi:hypothetical protein
MRRRAALSALLLAFVTGPASAQVPAGQITITGRVEQPATYLVRGLTTMPAVQVQGTVEDGALSTFVGPLLWPLITAARPIDETERGGHLQHVLFARGADGYAVAIAIAEIDPSFEGKPVVIAYKQDGALLPVPRLVVPGDRRAGRNVRDLVAVEVR